MQYNINHLVSSSGKRDRSSSFHTKSSLPFHHHSIIQTESVDQNSCPNNSKRMKSVTASTTTTPSLSRISNSRIFGDEISTNNTATIDEIIYRTHITKRDGSINSKHDADTDTVTSDCGTIEGSVVAQLRGKLRDFEQKNHHHYLKNMAIPSKEELEKPLRPKVKPSIRDKSGPTPLPKHSADALVRRMVDHTTGSNTAVMTSSVTTTPSMFRQKRSTPVRLRIKAVPAENVQATNEGYASVAKLSKWLADDPTSTKKIKQLRRGANIIAKSRKFDKVLANAEIEHVIPRDCVTRSKQLLQQALSSDDGCNNDNNVDDDDRNDNNIKNYSDMTTLAPKKASTPDWMKLGTTARMSVSDKKKWLSNAFQSSSSTESNDDCGSVIFMNATARSTPIAKAGKARTEIFASSSSSSLRNSDLGCLAKEKWRQRTPTKLLPLPSSSNTVPPLSLSYDAAACTPMNETSLQMNHQEPYQNSNVISKLHHDNSSMNSNHHTMDSVQLYNNNNSNGRLSSSNDFLTKSIVNDNNSNNSNVVDFHLARDMLVQRSKVNGNDVDIMTAFQRRKARFQQLEKETARRQSSMSTTSLLSSNNLAHSNLYKSTWDSSTTTTIGYVKTYKEDIAPKKSWTDLP